MLPANDFRPPRSLRKSNTATCEWLVLPLHLPKIKFCNVQTDSDHFEHSENQTLQLLKGFRGHTTSKSLTVRRAKDSISLRTRKSDKVTCYYRSHHTLQTSSVTRQRSNVFRWPHIIQKSDLHKAIRSRSHPPKVRLYDLRVTPDDLVPSEN